MRGIYLQILPKGAKVSLRAHAHTYEKVVYNGIVDCYLQWTSYWTPGGSSYGWSALHIDLHM